MTIQSTTSRVCADDWMDRDNETHWRFRSRAPRISLDRDVRFVTVLGEQTKQRLEAPQASDRVLQQQLEVLNRGVL